MLYNASMFNSRNITVLFWIYTILLAHLSLLALFVLFFVLLLPAFTLFKGPQELIFIVVTLGTEIFAVNIWRKIFKYLKALKLGITLEIKKDVIWMLVLTIIIPLEFFVFYIQDPSETAISQDEIIENKDAAQNCVMVKDLCVTKKKIKYKRSGNFGKNLKNAKKACSDLGMRLPTKEEYDVILTPLTSIKYALELNLTDKEFVYLERYYDDALRGYPLTFMHGNFLTSSIENGKAVTYKVDFKHDDSLGDCRSIRTKNGTRDVCIRVPIETPIIEYHDSNELIDLGEGTYPLLCVE